ncbi:helicase-like transcription factor CHR28 isoform X2 [Phalaenopsis equestris]|nr:helicase-like transcription factor CHR28 isoform X2 [Phalaenopsis equestris]XP_020591600.1 helicase-like transcription factor CHR28 isoform X2 [Phalaenopsis equestris]XP_020591601.1 helicase-like transcription factor CHR28 isoform X2 [Phalaenopsis equestris]
MDKSSSHSLPMQTEIIDIGSSDSDGDIDFEFDGLFDGTTAQSRDHSERFIGQNHGMRVQKPPNHSNGSASSASVRSRPFLGTSGEILGRTFGNNCAGEISNLSSEGAIHASQPKDHAWLTHQNPYSGSISNGKFDASHISGRSTEAGVSQTSKRILPSSLQKPTSGTVSVPSTGVHGKALFPPQKKPMQDEKNRWSQEGMDDDAHNHSRIETAHGFGESQMPSSTYVEDLGEIMGKNLAHEREKRALPFHWIDKTASNNQLNASMHSKGTVRPPNFGARPSYPVSPSNVDNMHKFSDAHFRNERLISTSRGLYKVRDNVFVHENEPATRILPQYPGKSFGNVRLSGSDGGNFSGSSEHCHGHDERPIYQEALQNLGQPKLEEDLPEGLLTVSLLKHQKIALAWMVHKEKSVHCAGGILADDQGLGKTISMIALILKQQSFQTEFMSDSSPLIRPDALNLDDDECNNAVDVKDIGKDDLFRKQMASTSGNRRPAAGTLVVCPASILRQWACELEEKVSSCAKLSVLVYHGGARTKDPQELAKHDIVLTTYSIVTNEVPRQPLVDDDDDENDQKNMEKYGLSSEFAASKKRKQTSNAGRKGKKKGKGLGDSQLDYVSGSLARVRWFRVILDEAQTIKNHRTQVARACCGLRAKRRWCLSGTPMQNSIDDLYSYFRFLKYDPYAVFKSFCNSIKYPISRNASQGYKKLQAVLRVVLLRRTKDTRINGEAIIKLPPKSICLKEVDFSHEERAFYMKLEADSRQQFKAYAAAGTLKQNYANILLMLLRLRQACGHPVLVKGYYSEALARDSIEMARQLPKDMLLSLLYQLEASSTICPVCSDTPEDPVVTMCSHVFCYQCVSDRLSGDDNLCPAAGCKETIGTDLVFSKATLRNCICDELDENAASSSSTRGEESSIVHSGYVSSKIKAAVDILSSLSSESYLTNIARESEDDWNSFIPVKAIVFSQWTGMLDLVEISLNQSFIQYRRLDGTMSLNARDRAVKDFNTDPEVTVMLMSLKAGNLGLNMVAACHVVLLDLWWNPTTEDQAIDRAHRIGQTRPVTVSRITIKDTIEDRILALQEEKRKLVSSAFGEDNAGSHAARLTVEDLKYLFMI